MKINKEISEYIIRVLGFCFAAKYAIFLFAFAGLPFVFLLGFIINNILPLFSSYTISFLAGMDIAIEIFILCGLYFLAKIFGIFKRLDKLNFFTASVVVFFISLFYFLFDRITLNYYEDNEHIIGNYTVFLLISAFFLYRFLQFLTKKFVFFQKLGYYFRFECYKKQFLKIKNKVKYRYKK